MLMSHIYKHILLNSHIFFLKFEFTESKILSINENALYYEKLKRSFETL